MFTSIQLISITLRRERAFMECTTRNRTLHVAARHRALILFAVRCIAFRCKRGFSLSISLLHCHYADKQSEHIFFADEILGTRAHVAVIVSNYTYHALPHKSPWDKRHYHSLLYLYPYTGVPTKRPLCSFLFVSPNSSAIILPGCYSASLNLNAVIKVIVAVLAVLDGQKMHVGLRKITSNQIGKFRVSFSKKRQIWEAVVSSKIVQCWQYLAHVISTLSKWRLYIVVSIYV